MKISIAMCTYNGGQYLPEQLQSIAAQTRLPDELVICDDGSSDNSLDVLDAFSRTAPFEVRWQSNPTRLRPIKNFERSISLCTGEVIALADQDDVWKPDKLFRLERVFMEKPEVGLVFTDADVVDEQLRPLGYTLWGSGLIGPPQLDMIRRGRQLTLLAGRDIVTGATLAFRSRFRDVLLPIPTHTRLIHDGWIALMLSTVSRLEALPERTILYRQHARQQLGAKPPVESTASEEVVRALSVRYPLQDAVDDLEAARARLEERPGQFPATLIRELTAHAGHLRMRMQIGSISRPARLRAVLTDVVSGRYRRYSNGVLSAAKDLTLPTVPNR